MGYRFPMRYSIIKLYVFLFSLPFFRRLNSVIIEAALRVNGYNNYRSNYDSGELFFIKNVLARSNPTLCVDIGANIGGYSHLLLSYTSSNVIAFEPLKSVYSDLRNNLDEFRDRVILENFGIGNKNDLIEIYYSDEKTTHSSFSKLVGSIDYVNNNKTTKAAITTLDDYVEKKEINKIDFIKIDTEGFEPEVFDGMETTILKLQPKFIQMEFNWHHLFRHTNIYYFSQKLPNYSVYQLTLNGMEKRDPKDPLSNIFNFSNFVFIRKDLEISL